MGKLFRRRDAFHLEGECQQRTEAELAALDRKAADAAFRAGQKALYEAVLRPRASFAGRARPSSAGSRRTGWRASSAGRSGTEPKHLR